MAPKRPSPLENPPAASSSDEEEATTSEEEEEQGTASGSESGSEEEEEDQPQPQQKQQQPKTPALTTPNHASDKKPPASRKPDPPAASSKNSKPRSSESGSESEYESGSDSEPEDDRRPPGVAGSNVKPIASKPMEETPKSKKPKSKADAATPTPATTRVPAKRPSESEANKDSKRARKKGPEPEGDDDPGAAANDETRKAVEDPKGGKFQRLWGEDDELAILNGIIDYTAKKGKDPAADMNAFHDFIKSSIQFDFEPTKDQLSNKIRRLKKKFKTNATKGAKYNPTKTQEQEAFDLSKRIWGDKPPNGGAEQPKSNGKAKSSSQKGTDLFPSPEASKEVENMEVDRNPGLSEIVALNKSFGLAGLPEHLLEQGLALLSESKRAELEEKWKKLNRAELELYAKRTQLIRDQAKLILDAYKSSGH